MGHRNENRGAYFQGSTPLGNNLDHKMRICKTCFEIHEPPCESREGLVRIDGKWIPTKDNMASISRRLGWPVEKLARVLQQDLRAERAGLRGPRERERRVPFQKCLACGRWAKMKGNFCKRHPEGVDSPVVDGTLRLTKGWTIRELSRRLGWSRRDVKRVIDEQLPIPEDLQKILCPSVERPCQCHTLGFCQLHLEGSPLWREDGRWYVKETKDWSVRRLASKMQIDRVKLMLIIQQGLSIPERFVLNLFK